MRHKSFANRLSWTILGAAAAILIVAQLAVSLVSDAIIGKEFRNASTLSVEPLKFLLHSTEMQIALVVITLVSLLVLFFVFWQK